MLNPVSPSFLLFLVIFLIFSPLPVTHLTNAVEGSVVHDVAAEVYLGQVGEVSEHRDEELRVDGGGVCQS